MACQVAHRPSSVGTFRLDAPSGLLFMRWIEAKLKVPEQGRQASSGAVRAGRGRGAGYGHI
jgi:hypothetical protein